MTTTQLFPSPQESSERTMLTISKPSSSERQVNARYLPALAAAFLADKQRSCTQRTSENYKNDLRPFLLWWENVGEKCDYLLSGRVLERFVKWLQDEYINPFGNRSTPHTQWRTTKRIRQMLTWGHEQGYITALITDLCPLVPDTGKLKYYPTHMELFRLIHAADGEYRLRDAALIAFSISTGARRFEVANAMIENLQFEEPGACLCARGNHRGWIRLRKVKGDSSGLGKGRISMFDTCAGLLLKAYLRSVDRSSGSIFGLSDVGISQLVDRLRERCALEKIHPHAFRNAFVDHWSEANEGKGYMADIAMKLQVGHKMPHNNVSLQYIDTDNERKNLRRIATFHTSPLLKMPWDWSRWPVSDGCCH